MNRIGFTCLSLLLFFNITVKAQSEQTVTGIVFDNQNRESLTGVSVLLKGTNTLISTDLDGKYSIDVPRGEVLLFSYVGYKTSEVEVDQSGQINVNLEPENETLNSITVVGTLGLPRSIKELATSNSILGNKSLNQGKNSNSLSALTSKVAGLRISSFDNSKVDGDIQVNLRGIRSNDRLANAPLYVVDGVPVPHINRINPNDIESINVLKGSNGAALYGSEGVNGVLLITTKKGSEVRQINFSNTTLFYTVGRFADRQTEFGNGTNGVYDPTQYLSWGPRYDGSIKPIGANLPSGNPRSLPFSPTNNQADFFKTGSSSQNDVAFSGGDALSTYYFSVQDIRTKGIIQDDKNSRTGARFNASRKFNRLKSSFSANYILTKTDETSAEPWTTAYRLPANIPLDAATRDWKNTEYANPNYWFSANQMNPFFNQDNNRRKINEQVFNGSFELNYEIAPWFDFIYRGGYYLRNTDSRNTVGKFSYNVPKRTNIAGSVNDANVNFQRVNSDVMIHLHQQFGKISTRLVLGNNVRADDTKAIGVGASSLLVPDLYNIGNSSGQLSGSTNNNYLTQYRQLAFYGEFTGGYNNYLFLTLSGRQESVSVLSPSNRSYFYPGVGLSFVASDALDVFKNSSLVSFAKVFASFNRTGNVNGIRPYRLSSSYSQIGGFPYGSLPGFSLGTVYPNPNLTPEFVNSFEVGSQLAFFQHRLNVDLAYAYSLSSNGIVQASLAGSTGYDAAWINAFEVSNSIVEVSVSGDLLRLANGLRWNMGFNLSHIKNRVEQIYGDSESIFNHRQSYAIKGKPFNGFMFNDYKRDAEGRIIVDGTTGNPVSTTEQVYGGTGTPPWQLGLNTSIDFKGFSISAQFDWRMGGVMYSETTSRMIQDGTSPITTQYNREPFVVPNSVIETAPGVFTPNTSVKVAGDKAYFDKYVSGVQTQYATSSDYFKLRELQISYQLPSQLLSKQKWVKSVNLSLIGRNLISIWAKDNVYGDPEYVYVASNSEGYLSFRQLPSTRQFGFSIGIGF